MTEYRLLIHYISYW